MAAFLWGRSSDCFPASLLLTQFPRVSALFCPWVLPSSSCHCAPDSKPLLSILSLSLPLTPLRLHSDLAALPKAHFAAGHWSPPLPARGAGAAVPGVGGQSTLEPNPEDRRQPGEPGPGVFCRSGTGRARVMLPAVCKHVPITGLPRSSSSPCRSARTLVVSCVALTWTKMGRQSCC